jgi:AsmA family/AsmA-like C-terminal region
VKLRSKRVIILIALLLLALFLVRPQVGLLHRKVVESLSLELGRRVEIAAVHIRFLPRPGLELENLTIHENSDFGAEPLLRSADVNAWLRVSSLFRRRIEISSLSLSDASLNLSRNSEGKWNFEELVERASKGSTAPTTAGKREARRIFPYIEAVHARINFKNGLEKTHFALINANFSLWQESENQWGMRMQASPIRTDANLTDTGVISINGAWQRSALLYDTPIQFSLAWKQAQIGQISRLLFGTDKEWRGSATLSSSFAGTLRHLKIASEASVDQLRRQDMPAGSDFSVAAQCAAEYNSDQRALMNLDCSAPSGTGTLELKGSAAGIPFSSYDLVLLAKNAPVQSALDLVRHLNQTVPRDLSATGSMDLAFSLRRSSSSAAPQLQGEGEAREVRLSSQTGAVLLGRVPFALVTSPSASESRAISAMPNYPRLQIGPINVSLGKPAPAQAQLTLSRSGYSASIRGEAGLKRLLQVAEMLRLAAPKVSAEGTTSLDLNLAGAWDVAAPALSGTAQLRFVHAQVRGLNSPFQIRRADLVIDEDAVRIKNVDVLAGESTWRGSLLIPRPCATPESCRVQFHLRSAEASAFALNRLFNPLAVKRPWYRLLGLGGSSNSFFLKTTAAGSIAIDKLHLGNAVCTRLSGDVDLEKAKLSLTNVRGNLFGGQAAATWKADFSVRPPTYSGTGSFDEISLSSVAELMRDGWIDGSGSADYRFKAAGWNIQELLDAAELNASFNIKDGVFPHVVLTENADPLSASVFSGQLALHQGNFSLDDTELVTEHGVFNVTGTASLAGELKLKMSGENSTGYNVSGTLDQTRVSPITNPPTQAALKP